MVSKLWYLYFVAIFITIATVAAAADTLLPEIQLDAVGGQLGFTGDFAGLSPYREPSQLQTSQNGNTIVISEAINNNNDDDILIFKSFATINGTIESYCKVTDTEFIIAGNFNTINQTTYNHIAHFNSQSRQFSPLDQGLDGAVKSIYCTADTIYVGGDFTAPLNTNVSQYTGHVALYSNNRWSPVPWKGFNGPVYTIVRHDQQSAIIFGGQFNSTGDGQYFNPNMTTSTTQAINLDSSVTISSGNGLASSDPRSVICNQSPWLLQDGIPGYWQAQFVFPIQPSRFRLTNVHSADGKNTRIFNIISLGSNQYFTLSYQDPVTNQILTCSEECPLSNDSSIPYQDFIVVDTAVSTSEIRINIDAWYGSAGGLGGITIFRSDATLQPNVVTNSSVTSTTCSAPVADGGNSQDTSALSSASMVSTTGTWTEKYAWGIYQTFLVSVIPASELHTADVSVTYKPSIPAQGIYEIYATTPGCVGTATCDQRVLMQLTMELTPGNTTTYALDQNVISDQRALIYTGPISASSGSFQPSIVMKVDPLATTFSTSSVTILGTALEFVRNSTSTSLSSVLSYFPSNNTWTALAQQLPIGSIVYDLKPHENMLYIGGQFNANTTFSNAVAYDFSKNSYTPLAQNGVNGAVHSLLLADDSNLIMAGAFNNTAIPQADNNLNHVAIYNIQSNTWSGMNQGVNNHVNSLYTTASNNKRIHLSGPFNATINGTKLYNNAEWDLSTQSWVTPTSYILGTVTDQLPLSDTATLYLGSIQNAQSYLASNAAWLGSGNGIASPITRVDPNAVVHTGAFWKTERETCLILAGVFRIDNISYPLVIHRNNEWQGLFQNVQGNITTLSVIQNNLLLGGHFNGTTADNVKVASIAFYDLQNQKMQEITGIFNKNQQPGVVNVIYPQGDGKSVYVGGDFAFAGMLDCDGICLLSLDTRQWTQPNQGISGTINDMYIDPTSRLLTVVGDLAVNQKTNVPLASIDTSSNMATWSTASQNDEFTSPTSLLYDSNNHFLIAGNNKKNGMPYIAKWNGQDFSTVETKLDESSTVNQLLWMPISSDSAPSVSRYPSDSDTMLMAVGYLVMPDSNTSCSAALFDGTSWHPYLLTSTDSGLTGSVDRMFTATACCNASYKNRRYLSVPAVILVSIAISLGILFLLIACAFLYLFLKRRNNPPNYYDDPMKGWKPKYRPSSLLAMLDAANLNGADATGAITAAAAAADGVASNNNNNNGHNKQPDTGAAGYSTALDGNNGATHRAQTSMDISDAAAATARYRNSSGFSMGMGLPFSVLLANALKSNDTTAAATEDQPKVYYAKYPFEAKEFGELAFDAQAPIVVTDTSDNVWWMGYKDDGSGKPVSGLFPSNYVTKVKPH